MGKAYPLVQTIDWAGTPAIGKYVASGAAANKAAMSSVLDAGLYMGPILIKAAVEAHKKALEGADDRLVTTPYLFQNVVVAIANMLAAAPAFKVNAIIDAVPELPSYNSDWLASLNPNTANEVYAALLETAAIVKGS